MPFPFEWQGVTGLCTTQTGGRGRGYEVVMTVLFSLRETSVTGLAALEKGFETASLDFGASAVIAPENPPPQGVH